MNNEIHYLDNRQSTELLQVVTNTKHKVCFLLMMDLGLRVSECISLRFKDFDFKRKILRVKSLKKREDVIYREIPISSRCYEALAEYIKTIKYTDSDAFLFPNYDNSSHITRKALNRVCERLKAKNPTFKNLHPHALRHTCATNLLGTGAKLEEIKEILGHKSYDTTLIYSHIPTEVLRQRIDSMTAEKPSLKSSLKAFFFPASKSKSIINIQQGARIFIGREKEQLQCLDLINKNVNVMILGDIGIGKTSLMQSILSDNKKVLEFDDFGDLKKTLCNALLLLYKNDKEHIYNMLYSDYDVDKTRQKLQKDSVQNLAQELINATQKNEYILSIDNCDRISPKGIKVLETLKDHFTIISTARSIPVNKSSFLWNFEIIRLENLKRHSSLELIHKLSYDMEIEDFEQYRSHIWEQSVGNPRVIFELIERYRKEIIVSTDIVKEIKHTGSLAEIDMSLFVMIGLGAMAILRYLGRENGNSSLTFIGGCAMILLIISRYFFSFTKRRSI